MRAWHLVDRPGELLRERQRSVEGPAWEVVLAPLQPGVGHPFVDQDDDGSVCGEQGPQSVGARRDTRPVGLGHRSRTLGAAQLPGQARPIASGFRSRPPPSA